MPLPEPFDTVGVQRRVFAHVTAPRRSLSTILHRAGEHAANEEPAETGCR